MAQSSPDSLEHILQFMRFTLQFRNVTRVIKIPDQEAWENDAEHSYQLTLLAWYMMTHHHLKLNQDKVIKLALVHDLVETYAGDTYIFGTPAELSSKKAREEQASQRITEQFPTFHDLPQLILEYEEAKTAESKFVRALDMLIPNLNIYLDHGGTWKRRRVPKRQLIDSKKRIFELHPVVAQYWQQLSDILETQSDFFTPSPDRTITPGNYRHYKGGEYEVLGLVRHTEDWDNPLVLYKPLYEVEDTITVLRVRPLAMFREDVIVDGVAQPRFVRIETKVPSV